MPEADQDRRQYLPLRLGSDLDEVADVARTEGDTDHTKTLEGTIGRGVVKDQLAQRGFVDFRRNLRVIGFLAIALGAVAFGNLSPSTPFAVYRRDIARS